MAVVSEHRIHQLFEISVFLKGFYALLECAAGVGLALVSTSTIVGWITWLTQDQIAKDPHDYIATHLLNVAATFSVPQQSFYVFYLLGHGLVKLLLVVGLLRNKLWAYPMALVAVSMFVVYQLYRYSYTQSIGLLLLTVFDLFFIALVWHEYQRARRYLPLDPRAV